MPDPIVLEPGDQQKIISQPPQGSQWHVQVDGADVYLAHNNLAVVREGTNVLPGDRVQVKNLEGSSYYAKNPSTNSDNAEIEVSEASAYLEFLNPFSQPDVRDSSGTQRAPATSGENTADKRDITVKRAEDLEWEDKSVSGTVASGSDENTYVGPPDDTEIWEIVAAKIIVPSISGASSGTHVAEVKTEGGAVDLLQGNADYNGYITYKFGEWDTGMAGPLNPSEKSNQLEILKGVRVDSTNRLLFRYNNSTDADQTSDRRYQLYVRKIKVA